MNDDELRRALDSYAALAPAGDPRPGLASRLRRRQRRRTVAVAGLACVAALAAATGVAVVTRERSEGLLVAVDPTAGATTHPTPSGSPEPSPSPVPEPSPSGTEASEPPNAPSREPSPREPHYDPPPYVTAEGSGEHGLRVKATLRPGGVPTAIEAVLTVEATDDDGSPYASAVAWGDGSAEPAVVRAAVCRDDPPAGVLLPSPRTPDPGTSTEDFSHAWRHAGTYTIRVTVTSDLDCQEPPVPEETATVTLTVAVSAGRVTGNGPAAPRDTDYAVDVDGRTATLRGYLVDRDGWVGRATIHWGDGSAPTVVEAEEPCDDGGGRHYPHGALGVDEEHVYPRSGTFSVTVRWASTGCDGRDAEEMVDSVDVTV